MVVRTVKRGYNMRFHSEEFWDEVLYLIPKGAELFDADCVPYYIDDGDGTPLREIYNRYAPYDKDVYQTNEPYEETVKYLEEAMREEKAQILARQEKEDGKAKMLRQLQASMKKIHKR